VREDQTVKMPKMNRTALLAKEEAGSAPKKISATPLHPNVTEHTTALMGRMSQTVTPAMAEASTARVTGSVSHGHGNVIQKEIVQTEPMNQNASASLEFVLIIYFDHFTSYIYQALGEHKDSLYNLLIPCI
jgi:hypothetical protein